MCAVETSEIARFTVRCVENCVGSSVSDAKLAKKQEPPNGKKQELETTARNHVEARFTPSVDPTHPTTYVCLFLFLVCVEWVIELFGTNGLCLFIDHLWIHMILLLIYYCYSECSFVFFCGKG